MVVQSLLPIFLLIGICGASVTQRSERETESPSDVSPTCGGVLTADNGTISSPNFPEQYPNDVSCTWEIRVKSGKRIQLEFISMALEGEYSCNDYIEIRATNIDGIDVLLGRFCGKATPPPIATSSDSVKISFHSNNSIRLGGFQIKYTTVEGPPTDKHPFMPDNFIITSPNFPGDYPSDIDVEYKLRVHPSKRIMLSFLSMEIERSSGCKFDYIEISETVHDKDVILGRYCGSITPNTIITSTGSSLKIHFHSDRTVSHGGFQLSSSSVKGAPSCGGVFTTENGTMSSPNFPESYSKEINCEWLIRVEPNKSLDFHFHSMGIEERPPCDDEFIEIRHNEGNEDRALLRIRRQNLRDPASITTVSDSFVKLVFHSNCPQQMPGFQISYSSLEGSHT